jgi:hypothetical protein
VNAGGSSPQVTADENSTAQGPVTLDSHSLAQAGSSAGPDAHFAARIAAQIDPQSIVA